MTGTRERKVHGSYDAKTKIFALTFNDGKAVTFKQEDFPRAIQERALQDGLFTKLRPAAETVGSLQAAVNRLKAGVWALPKTGRAANPRNLLVAAIVYIANAESKEPEYTNEKGRTVHGANAVRAALKGKDNAFIAKALTGPSVVKALAAMKVAPEKKITTVDALIA